MTWGNICYNADMQVVERISLEELKALAEKMYEPLVKAVADVEGHILVIDAGLHSDEELYLLEKGSKQENLWGFNLWPESYGTENFVEFDSLINIRPAQNNRSRNVENAEIREKIIAIVKEKVYV